MIQATALLAGYHCHDSNNGCLATVAINNKSLPCSSKDSGNNSMIQGMNLWQQSSIITIMFSPHCKNNTLTDTISNSNYFTQHHNSVYIVLTKKRDQINNILCSLVHTILHTLCEDLALFQAKTYIEKKSIPTRFMQSHILLCF